MLTPIALMKALLGAETDLLWFGGIGTYIKASTQTHAQVGDLAARDHPSPGDRDLLEEVGPRVAARFMAASGVPLTISTLP